MNLKTKRIVIIASAAVVVIAAVVIAVFLSSTSNPVLGKWSFGGENSGLTLTFKRDDTVIISSNGVDSKATYTVTNDTLTMTDSDGQTTTGTYKVTKVDGKKQIEWSISGSPIVMYEK
ncbi:hypothetical protein AAFA46_05725 [Oscillospiraceae bacterium WX1]